MTIPALHPDPDHHQPGTVLHHLAAAEYWLRSAHGIDDDDHYHGGPVADDDITQDTHIIKHASFAAAHAAIAQAKIAAGWPVA